MPNRDRQTLLQGFKGLPGIIQSRSQVVSKLSADPRSLELRAGEMLVDVLARSLRAGTPAPWRGLQLVKAGDKLLVHLAVMGC